MTALTVIALVLGLQSGSAAARRADVCAAAVDQALREFGLSLEAMLEPSWDIDYWNDNDTLPRELQQIAGYRFYGRPPQCGEGRLTIALTAQCGVTDNRSRSGCRIPGLRYGWF
ncbi:MAG: hypothetical protein WAS73_05495 [Defluviicoccus sp.]